MEKKHNQRQRERKLRASYRRRIWLAVILCLVLGIALGFLGGRFGSGRKYDLSGQAPFDRLLKGQPASTATEAPEAPEQVAMPTVEPVAAEPVEEISAEDEVPVEDEAPAEDEVPVVDEAPVEDEIPAEDESPAEDEAPVEAPAEVEAPTEVEAATATALPTLVTPAPMDEPTATATAAVTPAPAAEAFEEIVPFGQEASFEIELKSDGTVRKQRDADPYETLRFTLAVEKYLTNDYYQSTYGSTYQLKGTETSVAFDLTLLDYTGEQAIRPNDHNLVDISLETAAGEIITGNRVQDREIEGSSDITLRSNVPVTLYKRFVYDPAQGDMKYMVITTYENGVPYIYRCELGTPVRPTPVPTQAYDSLSKGAYNDSVTRMQQALIDRGFLAGASADGNFGSMTEEAVKAAQKEFGMEETGVADHEFLVRLYGEG